MELKLFFLIAFEPNQDPGCISTMVLLVLRTCVCVSYWSLRTFLDQNMPPTEVLFIVSLIIAQILFALKVQRELQFLTSFGCSLEESLLKIKQV